MDSLIQLKNYRPHPSNDSYMVFIYHDYRMAVDFEDGLVQEHVHFEKDVSENGPNKRWLYAIKKIDMKSAKRINNLAIGAHRKPFIPDKALRYTVMVLTAGLIIMAIIGYLKSN